ncbi:N-acetyl-gamma-glutamyl-phosphate reductase [Bartonella sp. HY406]|uniref:N-acetyl-gamma-glutamyl-phosphate reductase n=1 Tax=Bartonella sp. HY406 TaxID=2979331 RepID=UPI0021C5F11F|nr:N-acetyl-gamma-glutamyl-phosphate reductase [Bartonella sp. HY406]UXN04495.1 N-acetyl-gamma-glutamyl-phosphate reductase [Bartonella sp. HY406]
MAKVFIDGEHGTTGLQIAKRLEMRNDIELLSIPQADRRNVEIRADYLRNADIVILCLPDDASKEAVKMLQDCPTRIIDSSTAFRIDPNWTYGFAEMSKGQSERIANAQFVANPGCYPTGAISILRPLREALVLPEDYPVTINAVSGYTGGGKQLIAQMEDLTREDAIHANDFLYGLNLKHKHVPEITMHGLLGHSPIFTPSVGRFAQGMIVNVPLYLNRLNGKIDKKALYELFCQHYSGQDIVEIDPLEQTATMSRIDAEELVNTDRLKIYITGNDSLVNVVAVLDNLGKGASGAAVQNLNLMIG